MAVEDILAAITSEADAEVARIRAESADSVAAVLDAARAEAESIRASTATSRDEEARHQRERLVNRAHLTVERRLRAVAEEVYSDLLDEVKGHLAEQRQSSGYAELFRMLLAECRDALPEARIVLVDPADESLAQQSLDLLELNDFSVDPGLHSVGGLEIATEDRRRRVRNTVEARLDRADRALRSLAGTMVPALHGGTA